MGSSVYQCDLEANRKWKICLCQEIRPQHSTHDDALAGYNLVVLRRLSTFIRNRRWSRIRPRTARFRRPGSRRKTLDHHKRPDGRRGLESDQSVHQVFAPQELERHAHLSEPVQHK